MTEDDRNKDVMIYRYDPKRKYFLVSLHLENKPGALGNLANLLGIRGINILEGYFGGISYGTKGNAGFFVESTNQRMDAGWIKDFLESSVYVSDVEVREGAEGFLADSLNFPLTWNSGERAVLMRMEGLRAMLRAVLEADPVNGEQDIYNQGFSFGKASWVELLKVFRPKTKEGLGELLAIYTAAGWGRAELVELDIPRRHAKLRFTEGFECVEMSTGEPESHFTRGHMAGALSAFFGADVRAEETKCTSAGNDHCEFVVSP
jgi:predicted hydrocarbon binding protein